MPWDPKPQPAPAPQQSQAPHSTIPNGLPQQSYQQYNGHQGNVSNGGVNRTIKTEPGTENPYHGLPNNGYQPNSEGGIVRAQQLIQQNFGPNASASLNSMQQQRGGLALPGQQPRPQGLQLPAGTTHAAQQQAVSQQFQQQQQHAMHAQQQHQQNQQNQLHQQQQSQQTQSRIKVESDAPQPQQGNYQRQPHPSYQTDGADEGLEEWRTMLAERRAIHDEQGRQVDHLMRNQVLNMSENLQNGLMVPLDEQPSHPRNKKRRDASRRMQPSSSTSESTSAPSVPQFDGVDDEDDKANVKDEDDADAINSDLDDSDDDNNNAMGEDDDEHIDNILCTYDKVQRVKNKWKCTLKDGVMSVGGKEWVFHKGMGEFEW